MNKIEVICELIGLVGATGNNGKTPNTDLIILKALTNPTAESLELIRKEKHLIAPNCETCTSPCGNTSRYDINRFYRSSKKIKN